MIILWLERRRLLLSDVDLLLHTLGQLGNLPVLDMGELDLVVQPCGVLAVIVETSMAQLFGVQGEAGVGVLVAD